MRRSAESLYDRAIRSRARRDARRHGRVHDGRCIFVSVVVRPDGNATVAATGALFARRVQSANAAAYDSATVAAGDQGQNLQKGQCGWEKAALATQA